jgi:glycosyltransferase involved in cell wall biosynthesis
VATLDPIVADRLLIAVNDADFFLSHRLPVAVAARTAGFEVHIATADGPGASRIRAMGFTHHVLALSRSGTHPLAELKSIVAFYALFNSLKPDIAHLVTIKPVLYGGVTARIARVPGVVAAVTGLGTAFIQRGWRAALARRVLAVMYRIVFQKRNIRVIVQNPADRDTMVRRAGLRLDKSILIPGSGVDLSAYVPTARRAGPLTVVMAARLLRDKGVHEFVDAASLLKHRGVNARFWLAGDRDPGNPTSVGESDVAAWRSSGLVSPLGYRTDIVDVFSQADIVVLPSYREGLPRVLIEAAACGRAVITSDVPGCRDAIVPGVTGILVPPRDSTALADAIESLLADPPRREQMGRAGREFAEQHFSVESVVQAHLAIYRQLQSGNREPAVPGRGAR